MQDLIVHVSVAPCLVSSCWLLPCREWRREPLDGHCIRCTGSSSAPTRSRRAPVHRASRIVVCRGFSCGDMPGYHLGSGRASRGRLEFWSVRDGSSSAHRCALVEPIGAQHISQCALRDLMATMRHPLVAPSRPTSPKCGTIQAPSPRHSALVSCRTLGGWAQWGNDGYGLGGVTLRSAAWGPMWHAGQ